MLKYPLLMRNIQHGPTNFPPSWTKNRGNSGFLYTVPAVAAEQGFDSQADEQERCGLVALRQRIEING
jgi:hypothetical protein